MGVRGWSITVFSPDGKLYLEKQLLRLKCEAYSTLNESDDDPEAETRLQHRMGQAGGLSAPKQTLVAPASLYLTAILE
jgi:hypothetical protein